MMRIPLLMLLAAATAYIALPTHGGIFDIYNGFVASKIAVCKYDKTIYNYSMWYYHPVYNAYARHVYTCNETVSPLWQIRKLIYCHGNVTYGIGVNGKLAAIGVQYVNKTLVVDEPTLYATFNASLYMWYGAVVWNKPDKPSVLKYKIEVYEVCT